MSIEPSEPSLRERWYLMVWGMRRVHGYSLYCWERRGPLVSPEGLLLVQIVLDQVKPKSWVLVVHNENTHKTSCYPYSSIDAALIHALELVKRHREIVRTAQSWRRR